MRIRNLLLAVVVLIMNYNNARAQCASSSNIYSFVYSGKTYEIVKENKTWIEASACAVSRGGILAEINDVAEQNAIFTELNSNAGITASNTVAPDGGGGAYVWIGGNDLSVEGNWVWDGNNDNNSTQFWMGTSTGNSVGGLYNNWGNEPDDWNGQDALALSLNGWPLGVESEWNDVDHTNTLYYVIEHPTILCNSTSTINETACDIYTSPSGNYIWTSSNTYMDTITNAANCDSIITINLTINSVSDLTTTLNGTIITSNNNSATYLWLDCDNNFTIISGETGQSFTPITNGNYAVQLTENSCIDTSSCVAITTVDIIENNFGNKLIIYPNPTSGNFSIDLGDNYDIVRITFTDLNGKLIKSKQYNESQLLKLKIEEPAGIYLLMIESGDKKATIRLIKE